MPFLDHLEELRWRILWSLLAVAVGTVVGWFVVQQVDILEVLKRPIAPYLPGGRLVFTSPAEPFMLTLKVALGVGCVLASPVVIYQIWAFLAPALYERERRLILTALSVGVLLFLGGAIACYEWLFPAALKVFLGFQREDLTPMITIDRYFAMAVPFVVGTGAVAELPLVVTILASLGLVTPQFLSRHRRYAFVVSAFVAAYGQTLGKMAEADPELLLATPYKVVSLNQPEAVTGAVAWWQELTDAGGEGMVVKPLQFVSRNKRGLVQPAVKCRGKEYLRIIYGPEYTAPQNLERLRSRGLGAKRSLALREFALGMEALQRFVEREPLRRVHECAFAVLALESEPVDPRL